MVDSLRSYIDKELAAHYSREQITTVLLRYHYSRAQIDAAFDGADADPSKPKHSKVKVALTVAGICSMLLVIGFGVFFFFGERVEVGVLGVTITLPSIELAPGEGLRFGYSVSGSGEKVLRTSLLFEVFTLQDKLVTSSSDEVMIQGKYQGEKTLSLLQNIAPGSYYVKVGATYKGVSKASTSNFKVVSTPAVVVQPDSPLRCPSNCDDGNSCTTESCSSETSFRCVHDVITPCCGDGICASSEHYQTCLKDCDAPASAGTTNLFEGKSIFEEIDTISEIGKRDYARALKLCSDIEVVTYQHRCYTGVAVSARNIGACSEILDDPSKEDCYFDYSIGTREKEMCAKITKDSRRDQCYMDFVTKGDYSVCDKLTNRYLKQSCASMKQLAELNLEGFEIEELGAEEIDALTAEYTDYDSNAFADAHGLS